MMRKMAPWLVVALVCTALVMGVAAGALVAGGGSSGRKTASTQSHPRTVTVVRTGSTAASPGAAEQGGALATPNVAHGLVACVESLQGHATLTSSAIVRLEALCARIKSGGEAERDEARKEACIELVNNLQIPAGPAREHALAICHAP